MGLEIYIPNTGQGDCTFIKFPNGENMLVDFNKTDVDVDIVELLRELLPEKKCSKTGKMYREINYFVNTHPHDDHLKGIGALLEDEFRVQKIWESGHRLEIEEDEKENYKNYYDFLKLIKNVEKEGKSNVSILQASSLPKKIGDVEFYTLGPSKVLKNSKGNDIHEQCGIFKIKYKENSILFAGDSDKENWEERIVKYYSDIIPSTVLHVSHHGSKYFFMSKNAEEVEYTEGLEKIDPSYCIISVGKDNRHEHPHDEAMKEYKKYKAYLTSEHKSMFFAFMKSGDLYFKKNIASNKLKEKRDKIFEEHKNGNKSDIAKKTMAAVVGIAPWGK